MQQRETRQCHDGIARRLRFNLNLAALLWVLLAIPAQPALAQNPFDRLVELSKSELAKRNGRLKIALDWPEADTVNVLPEFKKAFPYIREIVYTREGDVGPFANYLLRIKRGEYPEFDIMHVAGEFETQYEKEAVFVKPPVSYKDINPSLPKGWPKLDPRTLDPNGFFLGTTGNARGVAWNPSLVAKGREPASWEVCADPAWKGKILLDTRNRLQSLQHDPKTRDNYLRWLKRVAANGPVLTQGQNVMVQKLASGEFPIACGINYHSVYREIDQGAPLKFVFPDPIPLEIGSRLYVTKWTPTPATTQLFALWLASGGQTVLERFAYRGFPWDTKSRKFPLAKNKYVAVCDAECSLRWNDYNKEYGDILGLPGVKK